MIFFSNPIKFINKRRLLSVLILILIILILFLVYSFIENTIALEKIVLILFFLVIAQVLVLQYFFKNQIKNDIIVSNLNNQIKNLKKGLKKTEKIAEYSSVYLANMSYEIRTPLNTVLGMLNMLKQTELDDDQKAQAEIAEYSSRHLLQLVNLVIDNADVDSGNVKLNMLALNLKSDLSYLFKVFEYQAWEKGLDFEFKFLFEEKNRKFSLIGDTVRIQQVIINLINNAIKFTNSGKISIIVDQTVGIGDDQIVTFYIKDTGIGMHANKVKHFLNTSTTLNPIVINDYKEGGLGLSISRKLVSLMGGELKLESKENEGSTFYFSLQLKKTLNIKTEEEAFTPILREKFSVLIAEDNRMNQKVIKFLLEKQGADCTFVKNGIEAVELYKILDFDMVFMDIYMPDMDGYQATKFIKNTKKYKNNKTPVIAVSASAFKEDIAKAKHYGIDAFLAKPIDVVKLKDLLAKYANK